MWEFLQANWLWIVLGLSVLFMFRMHGSGGCGMGHSSHGGSHRHEDESFNDGNAADPASRGSNGTMDGGDVDHDAAGKTVAGHRHRGC